MTSRKQLKAQVRARMAKTGERYTTALAHLGGASPDGGWVLRGGTDPDAAGLNAMLAARGISGLTEALLFGIGGGIGAGYILWEFKHDDSCHVTLGFSNSWQYVTRRTEKVLARLGIEAEWHRSAPKAAQAWLTGRLDAGDAVMVWPDRYQIGYWDLPETLDGHGGHPVVVHGGSGDRVYLDDRNLAPLTVARADLDRAVARVGTWKNQALVITDSDRAPDVEAAVREGLRDVVEHLSLKSDSFSLPAWRKWSRMMTDTKAAKAWPKVFADGQGLDLALQSVREGVDGRYGITGGNLRPLFADFLDEAGHSGLAPRWREIAEMWHAVGESTEFAEMGRQLAELYEAETDAIARLRAAVN
ncbi:BtrH N-terminal domain-containing protein [Lentzea sp. NBC_00516]|uniref:BtrH N-terminal domain-containing protein n=1 Tax=Lentzea sp. NBC_00516 TaxID=2903582 RepID=UPI002E807811|nr:BtrH N-terminal domain-containing protein [Lentzea sp. NBC_00516]WUD27523.1 BtrH N-terminal domain-containing protein [Lentzea sp. NBC_00516]